jgi:hypothetical protein
MPSPKNDDLTVLVFKDNSVARTFRVPLLWISRLGLTVGILTGIAILGVFLSGRFYWSARQSAKSGDVGYLQQLEHENSDLRTSLKQAQNQTQAQTSVATHNVSPAPTVTVTVTPAAEHAAEPQTPAHAASEAVIGTSGPVFSALPSSITSDLTNSPITLYEPKVNWTNHTLKVDFFIQYTKEDRGNQQGRIILLARGPETIMAYPLGIFNAGGQPALIDPQHGEYFSVSRIREVKADFKSANMLNELEVILLSTEGKLLVHQFLKPEISAADIKEESPKRGKKAAPRRAAPSQSGDQQQQAPSATSNTTGPAAPAAPTTPDSANPGAPSQ